jgi:rare lipoprotein A
MKCVAFFLAMLTLSPLAFAGGAVVGTASWYSSADACGPKTNNNKGCPTASGKSIYELERKEVLFAASNDFKIGTRLRVCNAWTGVCTAVTVLDRGGFKKYGRKIDLGKKAFSKIADVNKGTAAVTIERINP